LVGHDQGYLFSQPRPASEALEMLRKLSWPDWTRGGHDHNAVGHETQLSL
jgi:hypothetical protein